jgi:hypothetical protein
MHAALVADSPFNKSKTRMIEASLVGTMQLEAVYLLPCFTKVALQYKKFLILL